MAFTAFPIPTTTTYDGNLTIAGSLTLTGSVSINGTGKLGYTVGAGGSVTQAVGSKTNGVTINKACGQIIMDSAALAANTSVTFTVTNSQFASDDVAVLSIKGEATPGSYLLQVCAIASGSFAIHVRNTTGGSLSEALNINFAIIKCVVS